MQEKDVAVTMGERNIPSLVPYLLPEDSPLTSLCLHFSNMKNEGQGRTWRQVQAEKLSVYSLNRAHDLSLHA